MNEENIILRDVRIYPTGADFVFEDKTGLFVSKNMIERILKDIKEKEEK